jgi:hypothetical protein
MLAKWRKRRPGPHIDARFKFLPQNFPNFDEGTQTYVACPGCQCRLPSSHREISAVR